MKRSIVSSRPVTILVLIAATSTLPPFATRAAAQEFDWTSLSEQIDLHRKLVKNCGPLSAARVLRLHGHEVDLRAFMESCSYVRGEGVTISDVVQLCKQLEHNTSACRIDPKQITSLPTPCILVVNDLRHCLVLEKILRNNAVRIWDPSTLKRKRATVAEINQQWDGEAIIVRSNRKSFAALHVVVLGFAFTLLCLRMTLGRGQQQLKQTRAKMQSEPSDTTPEPTSAAPASVQK